jgi:hypothetical protein
MVLFLLVQKTTSSFTQHLGKSPVAQIGSTVLWDRFELVYTPKHRKDGSIWQKLNFNVLIGQCLRRRIDDIQIVRKEMPALQLHRDA